MEGVLTFIIIVIISFYALGFLGRLLLRWYIARKQREFAERFSSAAGGAAGRNDQRRKQSAKEGEIIVEKRSATRKRVNSRVGDYVEFEEVEEVTQEHTEKQ